MAEDDNPQGQQRDSADEKEFIEKTVFINPNVIENYWQKGSRPFLYIKKWRHLRLRVGRYDFLRAYHSLATEFGTELNDIVDEARKDRGLEPTGSDEEKEKRIERRKFRKLAKRARENFDALSEEERSKFRWGHLRDVRPAEKRRTLGLVGWGEIESSRSIEVFSVATKDKTDDINYKKVFHQVQLTIKEHESDHVGILMHWTEDLRRYDDDDPGEDYLVAEMYVKEGMLAELEQEVRQRGWKVPLDIAVQAHLFQYEVDESLAEPYHPQRYNMVYDKTCSIFVDTIRVGEEPKPQSDADDYESDISDDEVGAMPDPNAQFRKSILGAVSSLSASVGQIRIALWVLATILLLSLFV